ncbi:MAG: hypothetical protein Q8O89_00985 [Nanoarchaeota archaeon]|nr:hypothetical protein [Nanoarchaeota archaeon]
MNKENVNNSNGTNGNVSDSNGKNGKVFFQPSNKFTMRDLILIAGRSKLSLQWRNFS